MLKKNERLGRKELHGFFRRRTVSFNGDIIRIKAEKSPGKKTKFAFVVSGPKHRAAHLRNLARRRLSEAVKINKKDVPEGLNIVILMKIPETRKVPKFADIKRDIQDVISKLHIH